MENIIKHETDSSETRPEEDVATSMLQTAEPRETPEPNKPSQARPMQIKRFLFGVLLATVGVSLMLSVAFGLLHSWGVKGDFSMPAIGLCMIIGLMFLGGGFGVMATASGTFDDGEFDRLMAGENRRVDEMEAEEEAVRFLLKQKDVDSASRRDTGEITERMQTS